MEVIVIMPTIEERLSMVEQELAELKKSQSPKVPWYEKIAGTFSDNDDYDEAMRLGREYRESLRPPDDKARQ